MSILFPERVSDQRRLLIGSLITVSAGFLSLAPISLGLFGGVWPLALLWPLVAWQPIGANISVALLLLGLGLAFDLVTGAPLGSWGFIVTISYGLMQLQERVTGALAADGWLQPLLSAIYLLAATLFVSLLQGDGLGIVSILLPLTLGYFLYPLVCRHIILEKPI